MNLVPSLGMVANACKATNATGSVWIATGRLTNFLVNQTLDPGILVTCPADPKCQPGPARGYQLLITANLVGQDVISPNGKYEGQPKTVHAVENGEGTVLTAETDSLTDFHTATLTIVTPCIQAVNQCAYPPNSPTCFQANNSGTNTVISFSGLLTNCGDIVLTNVTVSDSRATLLTVFSNGFPALPTGGPYTVSTGAVLTYSGTYIATPQEVCAGQATNTITVRGQDRTAIQGHNALVTSSATAICQICKNPCLTVTKNCDTVPIGLPNTVSGRVTNCGNIALTNIVIEDNLYGRLATIASLTNGESQFYSVLVTNKTCGIFPNIVTATASSLCGLPVTASATNTCVVSDTKPPTLTCPTNREVRTDPGRCFAISVSLGVPLATNDDCGILTVTNNAPAQYPKGVTPVIWTAVDTSGKLGICTQTVTVIDDQVPVITCPPTVTVVASAGQCAVTNVNLGTPVATDNCDAPTLANNAPATFPVGTHSILWTAYDASGNTATCVQTVIIKPWITCPANQTNQCGGAGLTFGTPTANDTCGTMTITVLSTVTNLTCGNTFVATRTWSAADQSGNSNQCSQTIATVDTTPPTFTFCPANQTNQCGGVALSFGTPTASDACGTVTISVMGTVTNLTCGKTFVATRTWSAVDQCGNRNACSQTIATVDTTPPGFTFCPANQTNQCGGAALFFGTPSASDTCDIVTISVVSTVTNLTCGNTFVATRTWSAADQCGNSNLCRQTIATVDTTPPVITCPTNLVFAADSSQCYRSNVLFTVSATDNCDVTSLESSLPSGSSFPVGTTTVTNTATDACGNTSRCLFTVTVTGTVADPIPPICTCSNLVLTADVDRCSRSNVTLTVSATDNCGVTNLASSPPSGSTFPVGVTAVTSTATDASGNTNTCTCTVTVTDSQPPAITCPVTVIVNVASGRCFATNVALGTPTTSDNCGVASVTNNAPAEFPLGTNSLTWTVTDMHGNTATCQQQVIVKDTQPPQLTCPTNLFLPADAGRCDRSNVTFTVTATDNCNVTNLVSSPPSGSTFPVGVTVVTSTAADVSGNTNTCTFAVTVTDTQPPAITCPSNLVLTADAGQCYRSSVSFTVSATDNCRVTNLVSSLPSGSSFPIGTTTVTNSATDASGNTNRCLFTVTVTGTVTDHEPPAITCPTDMVFTADAGQCSRSNVTFTVSATDNCGVTNLVSSPPSGSTFPLGVTSVTSTATDASGNTNTCTFKVTVADTQPPVITCPADVRVANARGLCGSNVVYAISARDNCAVLSTNQLAGLPSGSLFPVGVTTNTFRVSDAANNTTLCSFTVTVTDTEKPVITCPANLVLTANPGQCYRSNVIFTVSATDNCGVTNLVSSPPSGSAFPVGLTTVTSTATDASGNTGTCTFTVNVPPNSPPQLITSPNNLRTGTNLDVTFTVLAKCPESLSYQWRLNGVNLTNRPVPIDTNSLIARGALTGATSNVLTIYHAQPADAGSYVVAVQNDAGVTESAPALLWFTNLDGLLNSSLQLQCDRHTATGLAKGRIASTNGVPTLGGGLSWTCPSDGFVTFTTAGSSFDTILTAYAGSNCTNLCERPPISDDDSGGFATSLVRFNAGSNTTYRLLVTNVGGAAGQVLLSWELHDGKIPEIVSSPVSRATIAGALVEFTAAVDFSAGADTNVNYAWFQNDRFVTTGLLTRSQTNPQVVTNKLSLTNGPTWCGIYTLVISNATTGLFSRSLPASLELTSDPGSTNVISVDKFEQLFSNTNQSLCPLLEGVPARSTAAALAVTPLWPDRLESGVTAARGGTAPFRAGSVGFHKFSNFGASHQAGEPNHCGVIGGASKWLLLTNPNPVSGVVILDTIGSEFDTVLAVYTNRFPTSTALSNLVEVACDDNSAPDGTNSWLWFNARPGVTYIIAVDGKRGETGCASLNWQGNITNFQWVALQPLETGTLFIDPKASGISRVLSTWTATDYTDLQQVAFEQHGSNGLVTLEVTMVGTNRSYLIAVEPASGTHGPVELDWWVENWHANVTNFAWVALEPQSAGTLFINTKASGISRVLSAWANRNHVYWVDASDGWVANVVLANQNYLLAVEPGTNFDGNLAWVLNFKIQPPNPSTATNIVLAWEGEKFKLQSLTNRLISADWMDATNVVTANNLNRATNSAVGVSTFYRLKSTP